ncbi:MAG: hypothetical protein PX638_22240 [Microcystis sp. M53599_WE4]|nr:hypothetical protein [Microcystis sp. M53599_WE4]
MSKIKFLKSGVGHQESVVSGSCYAMDGVIRDLSIVFPLERTNQLSLLPDKNLVDLCHPIEPCQVTKNHI